MAKYSNTKAKINEKIATNGRQSVTGAILNDVLQTMVDSLGADYQFGGLVQPGSSFTAGEQPVVFLATTPGTYTNFGGLVVADGEVALLVWSSTAWSKQTPDIATRTEVSQLGQEVIKINGFEAENTILYNTTQSVVSIVKNLPFKNGNIILIELSSDVVGGEYRLTNQNGVDAGTLITFYGFPLTRTLTLTDDLTELKFWVYGLTQSGNVNIKVSYVGSKLDELNDKIDGVDDSFLGEEQIITNAASAGMNTLVNCDISDGDVFSIKIDGTFNASMPIDLFDQNTQIITAAFKGKEYVINATRTITRISGYLSGLTQGSIITTFKKIGDIDKKITASNYNIRSKNILMLGDSITALKFRGYGIAEYFNEYTKANVINGAFGGRQLSRRAQVSESVGSNSQAYANTDIPSVVDALVTGNFDYVDAAMAYLSIQSEIATVNVLKSVDLNTIDCITIFAGTNDSTNENVVIGDIESATEINNICGAIKYIIEKIHTNYPHIAIYFFTPIVRVYNTNDKANSWSNVYVNPNGLKLTDVVNGIENAAKYNNTPVCNLYYGMNFTYWNIEYFFTNLDSSAYDGTHPMNGFKEISHKMAKFIQGNMCR